MDEKSIIGTDHAPHTLDDKAKGTWNSSPGIPNLETVVPLLLTEVNNKTKAEYSPFDGWEYKGMPIMTIVNGKTVMNKL